MSISYLGHNFAKFDCPIPILQTHWNDSSGILELRRKKMATFELKQIGLFLWRNLAQNSWGGGEGGNSDVEKNHRVVTMIHFVIHDITRIETTDPAQYDRQRTFHLVGVKRIYTMVQYGKLCYTSRAVDSCFHGRGTVMSYFLFSVEIHCYFFCKSQMVGDGKHYINSQYILCSFRF